MYCYCGALLQKTRNWQGKVTDVRCPKHGVNYKEKPARSKIGKYSGQSKSPHKYGDYQ